MNKLAPKTDSALWNDVTLAAKLGVSRSMVHKLRSAGRLPQPIRLGRCLRWHAELIMKWISDGCPNPASWEGDDHA